MSPTVIPRHYGWLDRSGISYRQLDYWARCGYLAIDDPAPGSGYNRELSADTQQIAVTLRELTTAGFTPSAAAPLARAFVLDRVARFEIAPDIWLLLTHLTAAA